jgi:serine/threonine protein phosphatase 1
LETALALDQYKPIILYPKTFYVLMKVYIGHTPVTRIGETPIQKANVWNVDTGAAFKGPLTIWMLTLKNS